MVTVQFFLINAFLFDLLITTCILATSLLGPALYLLSQIRISRILRSGIHKLVDEEFPESRTPKIDPGRVPNAIPRRIHPFILTVTIISIFIVLFISVPWFICLRPQACDLGNFLDDWFFLRPR